ncbi:MAG: hypothetical protein QXG05_08020 [Nitrososphaerota archaeon]
MKLDKATFQLIIGILTASSTLLATLIQLYIHNPELSAALGLFVGTVITQIIIWLREEEPQQTQPATTSSQPTQQLVIAPPPIDQKETPLVHLLQAQQVSQTTYSTKDAVQEEPL